MQVSEEKSLRSEIKRLQEEQRQLQSDLDAYPRRLARILESKNGSDMLNLEERKRYVESNLAANTDSMKQTEASLAYLANQKQERAKAAKGRRTTLDQLRRALDNLNRQREILISNISERSC